MLMCDSSDDDSEDLNEYLIDSRSPPDGSSKDVILPVGPLPDASSIVISDGELARVCEPGDDGIESLNEELPKYGILPLPAVVGHGDDEACEDSKVKLQDLELQPDGLSEDPIIAPPVVSGEGVPVAKFMWDLNALPDDEEYENFNSAVVPDVSIAEPEVFLEDMVMFVRKLAVDPLSKKIKDLGRCFYMALDTRRILFMGMELVSIELEYPDQIYVPPENKRHPKLVPRRSSNALHSLGESNFKQKRHGIADLLSLLHDEVYSARSSQINSETLKRKLGKLVQSLVVEDPVVEVRIGPDFQAEIPNWTGPPNSKSNCDDDARWLGTRLWPIAGGNEECDIEGIGAGRPDICLCHPPGSKACVRYHNSKAKIQLRSELGPAFYTMGFDMMGDDVSASWARVDQITFDILVRANLFTDGRTFLGPALKQFPSRSRREIIAYYFNVHVPRRMSSLTREKPEKVDSDDDGCDGIPSKNSRARMKMLKTVARKGGLLAAKRKDQAK